MAPPRPLRALILAVSVVAAGACDVSVKDGEFNIGLASERASDEWKREYTIQPGGRLEIRNINGPVTVEPAKEGEQVQVRAERTARAASEEAARELLGRLEIEEEVGPAAVRVRTKAPSGWRQGHEVKYFVRAPASIEIAAHTTNGPIRLHGLPNGLEVSSVNGGIQGDGLSGAVEARTTNGGVDIQMTTVQPGGVKLSTTNGGISLGLPRDARADISARVTNGGIDPDDSLGIDVRERSRRTLDGRLNGGGSPVELSTTNGGIQIRGQ